MKIVASAKTLLSIVPVCTIAFAGHANIKKLTYNASNITMYPNYKCSAKAYSRTNQTMCIYAALRKPLYKVFFSSR